MSRSKAASGRSTLRTGCSRRSGAATLPCRRSTIDQIVEQLALAVDRVMAEGSLYDRELAALAIKQARGDLIEAIFLLRAYRTTLPRFGYSRPLDTAAMPSARRISATFKDLPGGQMLGPTFDYTHRLLDFELAAEGDAAAARAAERRTRRRRRCRACSEHPRRRGPDRADGRTPRRRARRPHPRAARLPGRPRPAPAGAGARRRGLSAGARLFDAARLWPHPSLRRRDPHRRGRRSSSTPEELGFAVPLGTIRVTECQMVNQFKGSAKAPPQFTRGYGLVFGQRERKAMAMALVDRALRADELGEERHRARAGRGVRPLALPTMSQATGFVEHLKLPHYVDFQAELDLLRRCARTASGAERGARRPRNDTARSRATTSPISTSRPSG